MSLFRAREWWSTVSGYEEFHTSGSLTLATVNVSKKETNIILVGSFNGILRAYHPTAGPFSPNHLLLETQLQLPIVKLCMAKLKTNSSSLLVILHTKQLIFYSLSLNDSQLTLTPLNQFPLSHTPYDMIIGSFGRCQHERVCVQSLDGELRVFDTSGEIFTFSLSHFLLPSPFCYVKRTDTFLISTAGRWSLEAYRYQTLCGGKKGKCDWSLYLGEPVVSMTTVPATEGHSYVMILGERNIICLRDMGTVVFSKKLESYVSCLCPYKCDQEDTISYILAGRSQQLQIFTNQVMKWSAQLPHEPVSLDIGTFDNVKGLIVSMDELGQLQCSYLGTDPTSFIQTFATSGNSVSTVQELESELKLLQSAIEEIDKDGIGESQTEQVKVGKVTFTEPRPYESDNEEQVIRNCVEAKVQLLCSNVSISDLSVSVELTSPLSVHPSNITCLNLREQWIDLMFVCSNEQWASQRHASLLITYINNQEHIHRIDHTLLLPLKLFCVQITPQDGQHKITLECSQECVPLSIVYPSPTQPGIVHNAVGFKLLTGETVTMIASKSSNKYRIQSDYFPALYMFTEDLVTSLKTHHDKDKSAAIPTVATFTVSSLPLSEFFDCIEHHHQIRLGQEQCAELLERHSRQFRAIQKRLLTRFKDKTPTGLVHLDTLLDGTFMQLMALTERCEGLKSNEDKAMNHLISSCQLIVYLVKLCPPPADLNDKDIEILQSVLIPPVTNEQGWEELVDLSLTHLFKTSLAKTNKDKSTTLPDLTTPTDCKLLKRHLALLFERIRKGGRLSTVTRSLKEQEEEEKEQDGRPPAPLTNTLPLVHHLPSLTEEDV